MEVVALIISGSALFIAVIAFQRTGGIKDLWGRAGAVSSRTQMVRNDLQHRVERPLFSGILAFNQLDW